MAPQLIEEDGVTVYIYGREHLPPHVHAFYAEDQALINIRTGEVFRGHLPSKKLKVVQQWLKKHGNRDLVEQNFYELNPSLKLPTTVEIKKKVVKKKVVKKKKKKKGDKDE